MFLLYTERYIIVSKEKLKLLASYIFIDFILQLLINYMDFHNRNFAITFWH